jgi:hypothetical protein
MYAAQRTAALHNENPRARTQPLPGPCSSIALLYRFPLVLLWQWPLAEQGLHVRDARADLTLMQ